MNTKKLFIATWSIVFAMVILTGVLVIKFRHREITYLPYTVETGDVLWEIAAKSDIGKNRRVIVDMIREKNNITPVIYEGQKILIPVKDKKEI